jgi:hypothetical protein
MSQRAFSPLRIGLLTILGLLSFFSLSQPVYADQPHVGRKEAAKYFIGEKANEDRGVASTEVGGGSTDHVLMLHIGAFVNSHAYNWDNGDSDAGRANYGVTYLLDTWSSMDVNLRLDFNEYKLQDSHPIKLSILPLLTFPMAESHFPVYFGAGAGPGIFFKQANGYSNLSLDYQLVVGVRFMDLYENLGAFAELGIKNHILLTSGGQFNGTALNVGAVFTF